MQAITKILNLKNKIALEAKNSFEQIKGGILNGKSKIWKNKATR